MARKCIIIRSSKKFKRHICVDLEIWPELKDFLREDEYCKKKFQLIIARILEESNIYFDLYGKEGNSPKTKNITAMKFLGGSNTRIYCKEVSTPEGVFYVIAAKLLASKKVQKNDKTIQGIVSNISDYEYEIVQPV